MIQHDFAGSSFPKYVHNFLKCECQDMLLYCTIITWDVAIVMTRGDAMSYMGYWSAVKIVFLNFADSASFFTGNLWHFVNFAAPAFFFAESAIFHKQSAFFMRWPENFGQRRKLLDIDVIYNISQPQYSRTKTVIVMTVWRKVPYMVITF